MSLQDWVDNRLPDGKDRQNYDLKELLAAAQSLDLKSIALDCDAIASPDFIEAIEAYYVKDSLDREWYQVRLTNVYPDYQEFKDVVSKELEKLGYADVEVVCEW